MRSRAIVRELVKQLMQADADEEHHKRMRKILKTRNYPDEDDDDPIDADRMRTFGSTPDGRDLLRDHPDMAHRTRTKVVRICSDLYAPAVGQHQLPGYRAPRANFAFGPACGTYL